MSITIQDALAENSRLHAELEKARSVLTEIAWWPPCTCFGPLEDGYQYICDKHRDGWVNRDPLVTKARAFLARQGGAMMQSDEITDLRAQLQHEKEQATNWKSQRDTFFGQLQHERERAEKAEAQIAKGCQCICHKEK